MPTYEYRCEKGHEFEAFQKMSDEPLDTCPECGAAAERKISSGAGLVFKGSGFYITDYKKAGEKAAGEKKAGESKGAESSGSKADGGGSETSAKKNGTSGGGAGD